MGVYQTLCWPLLALLLMIYGGGFVACCTLSVIALAKLTGRMRLDRPAWLFGSVDRTMVASIGIGVGVILIDQAVRAIGVGR